MSVQIGPAWPGQRIASWMLDLTRTREPVKLKLVTGPEPVRINRDRPVTHIDADMADVLVIDGRSWAECFGRAFEIWANRDREKELGDRRSRELDDRPGLVSEGETDPSLYNDEVR